MGVLKTRLHLPNCSDLTQNANPPRFFIDDGVVRFVDPRGDLLMISGAQSDHKVLYVNESRPERRFHVAFFFGRNSFTTDGWINDPKLGSTHNVLDSSTRLN